jgi:hypothetical protein
MTVEMVVKETMKVKERDREKRKKPSEPRGERISCRRFWGHLKGP